MYLLIFKSVMLVSFAVFWLRHDEKLIVLVSKLCRDICTPRNISVKIKWVEQMSGIEDVRNVFTVLVGKPQKKKEMEREICVSVGQ